ncbi:MAG: adenylate/guanylate cyclase domain-containing protein [Tateyamaria sp.]|uniref:adenylate/guanylate cyclase domain-containing protein n=1 Tax=Tateyamaria sp. TaxID=1929288 RepID=UPI00329BF0CA
MRIGLHTDDVIEASDDFFGTVVNKAARVSTAAEPDEILASDATRVIIGGAQGFIFGDSTEVQLKGFEGCHMVHGLTWQT